MSGRDRTTAGDAEVSKAPVESHRAAATGQLPRAPGEAEAARMLPICAAQARSDGWWAPRGWTHLGVSPSCTCSSSCGAIAGGEEADDRDGVLGVAGRQRHARRRPLRMRVETQSKSEDSPSEEESQSSPVPDCHQVESESEHLAWHLSSHIVLKVVYMPCHVQL
uniref:Uncharacterized protein n=1 Tax=Setaria italica TaxID=4555 RepID=K3ZK32_SETIT